MGDETFYWEPKRHKDRLKLRQQQRKSTKYRRPRNEHKNYILILMKSSVGTQIWVVLLIGHLAK